MKVFLICIITVCLLFTSLSIACADVFRLEPAVSYDNLSITGGTNPEYQIVGPVLLSSVTGETDLGFIRLGMDLGCVKTGNFSYLTVVPRAGWEFWILDYKIKLYEGYKIVNFTDSNYFVNLDYGLLTHTFSGFVLNTEIESKISEMFAWTGSFSIPETCSYRRYGLDTALDNISQSDWSIGLKFTLLPLYDILVKYHASEIFDRDQNFKITSNEITASVSYSF